MLFRLHCLKIYAVKFGQSDNFMCVFQCMFVFKKNLTKLFSISLKTLEFVFDKVSSSGIELTEHTINALSKRRPVRMSAYIATPFIVLFPVVSNVDLGWYVNYFRSQVCMSECHLFAPNYWRSCVTQAYAVKHFRCKHCSFHFLIESFIKWHVLPESNWKGSAGCSNESDKKSQEINNIK